MHFYNTKGTRRPPPPPHITLCPDLSLLSPRLPAAQGVAVNQVSLELSRSRGRRRLRCVQRERSVPSIPFLLPAADVDRKAVPQPAPDLSPASFVSRRSFAIHSLAKESLIRGHLRGRGAKGQIFERSSPNRSPWD